MHVDPEIVDYAQGWRFKQAWSQKVTREYGKKIVVCGGSSCAHSIMGLRMLQQHGLPTVNMGLHAGFGANTLIRASLGELHPGDTFVIAVEPTLLTKSHEMSSFACKLGYATGHPEWVYSPWETPFAPYLGTALRCTTGWKWLMLIPSVSRKAQADNHSDLSHMDASGWQTTSLRPNTYYPFPPYNNALSEDNRKLLQWVRQWGERNRVRIAYSLPWQFQEPEDIARVQSTNRALLEEIATILPVLKDTRMGVCTDIGLFSDTVYHLNAQAAPVRTDELARQIQNWEVWKPGELEAWDQAHPGSEQSR